MSGLFKKVKLGGDSSLWTWNYHRIYSNGTLKINFDSQKFSLHAILKACLSCKMRYAGIVELRQQLNSTEYTQTHSMLKRILYVYMNINIIQKSHLLVIRIYHSLILNKCSISLTIKEKYFLNCMCITSQY